MVNFKISLRQRRKVSEDWKSYAKVNPGKKISRENVCCSLEHSEWIIEEAEAYKMLTLTLQIRLMIFGPDLETAQLPYPVVNFEPCSLLGPPCPRGMTSLVGQCVGLVRNGASTTPVDRNCNWKSGDQNYKLATISNSQVIFVKFALD